MWEVTAEDVLNRWSRTSEEPDIEDPVFLTLLQDAVELIQDEFPDLESRIPNEKSLPSKIKRVTAKIIQRAMSADYSSWISVSNTDGPFGSSRSKESSSRQGLFLDDDDMEDLLPKGSTGGGIQVISVNPSKGGYYYDGYYW